MTGYVAILLVTIGVALLRRAWKADSPDNLDHWSFLGAAIIGAVGTLFVLFGVLAFAIEAFIKL